MEKPHILIVDDEPSIRLTLETGLSLKGFRKSLRMRKFRSKKSRLCFPKGDTRSEVVH